MSADQPSHPTKTEDTAPAQAPWTETFGTVLCLMSRDLGLRPEDMALCVASVLANLTGGTSGLDTQGGMRIPRGISLIGVGNLHHRHQRLVDHLLDPIFGIQDFLRDAAARSSRFLTDLYSFGPGKLKDRTGKENLGLFRDRLINLESAMARDLASGDGLPIGWDLPECAKIDPTQNRIEGTMRQRIPGLRHHPSCVLCPSDITQIQRMMAEVPERHAFIVDPGGKIFQGTDRSDNGKAATAMRHLSQAMGGMDIEVPPVHSDQGYGSFWRCQARLWSSSSLECIGNWLGDEEVLERGILEHALLWNPAWYPIKPLSGGRAASAWVHYKTILERIVNERASRTGTVLTLHQGQPRELELLDIELMNSLDKYSVGISGYLRPFNLLIFRLFWAFSLLKLDDEPDWPIKAARVAALYALQSHVSLIESAMAQVQTQKVERFARKIVGVLKEGPRTARELQRAIFKSRRDDIEAALQHLQGQQQVVYQGSSRQYDLPGHQPESVFPRTSTAGVT